RRAKFPETKFRDGETYSVYVRAKPNAQYAAADWGIYTFTWSDEDHDNDFIPDDIDADDDNDGIPDAEDDNPIAVGGTVYAVKIEGNAFISGTISIVAGDSVTWVNRDESGHSVAAEDDSWSSPPLQHNESYTHTFSDPGVFPYYDPTYPDLAAMQATITVNAE
ncbi:MAG: Blue copper protein, partial [uncultured bacterium]